MINITLAQINPTIGDMTGNIALMLDAARQARHAGAALVIFPELSLTGYYPGDLLDEPHFQQRLATSVHDLLTASRETPSVHWAVGLPVLADTGTNKKYFNGLCVIRDGEFVSGGTYFKQNLPTYDVFDERRHFAPGPDEACVVNIQGLRVGFFVCEDGWNHDKLDYPVDPWERLRAAAPDIVVSINASPANSGKRQRRHEVFRAAVASVGLPLVWLNQVGGHDQLVYDGSSFLLQRDGRLALELAAFEPAITTVGVQLRDRASGMHGEFVDPKTGLPLSDDPARLEIDVLDFYIQMIVLGLRDYARRCGFSSVVVGCSGGIDSALTLALAVLALGPSRVVAITMPSAVSSAGSVDDSVSLCRNLGIQLHTVPIRDIVSQFDSSMLASTLSETASGIARENLQPRIRATLLMTYSNLHGHLLLTTGNKSESMVGFCTIGGDTMGGLNLIGDLYKTEVFDVARRINERAGTELIPAIIIDKPPSAELAEGQLDSQRLPPYPVLDAVLKSTIEAGRMDAREQASVDATMQTTGDDVVRYVRRLISLSEYKRRQSPPTIRLRARAIGSGRQVPIAAVHF